MFDSTDPTILALVQALNLKVTDYKVAATDYASKDEGVSLKAMLDLPMSDDANLIISYTDGQLGNILNVDEHDGLADKFKGNENVYAHIAQSLRQAAEYFEGVAKDWAPSLCGKSQPVTFEDVQSKAAACDTLFRSIVEMCNETISTDDANVVKTITGQDVQVKKYEDGKVSFLLGGINRFRAPRKVKATDNTGTLSFNVDGVPVQTEGPWDLNASTLRVFGFTSRDLLAQFKSAGVKFEAGTQLKVNGKLVQVTKID